MSVNPKPINHGSVFNINYFETEEETTTTNNSVVLYETVIQNEIVEGNVNIEEDLIVSGQNINLQNEPVITNPNLNIQNNQLATKAYLNNALIDIYPQNYYAGYGLSDKDLLVYVGNYPAVELFNFSFNILFKDTGGINTVDLQIMTNCTYLKNDGSYKGNYGGYSNYRLIMTKQDTPSIRTIKYLKLDGDDLINSNANTEGKGFISCGITNNNIKVIIYFKNSPSSYYDFSPNPTASFIAHFGFSCSIIGQDNIIDYDATSKNAYLSNFTVF